MEEKEGYLNLLFTTAEIKDLSLSYNLQTDNMLQRLKKIGDMKLRDVGKYLKDSINLTSSALALAQIIDLAHNYFAYTIYNIPPQDHINTGNFPVDLTLKILTLYGLERLLINELKNIGNYQVNTKTASLE